jgi:hypothetical protein
MKIPAGATPIISCRCHQPVYYPEMKNAPRTSFGKYAMEKDCLDVHLSFDQFFVYLKFPNSNLIHLMPWANIKQVTVEEDGTTGADVGSGQESAEAEGLSGNLGQDSKLHKAKRGSGRQKP